MFDGLLENMKEQEAALRLKMQELIIEESLQGVRIEGNANFDIHQITLDESLLSAEKKEELEDLLVTCFSAWKAKAEKEAADLSAKMVEDVMPPGLDDLFKNFK